MGRKPVIAMVTDSIQPYFSGGKETRYYELSRRLAQDFDVHVYTMAWWSGPRTISAERVTLHGLCRTLPMYTDGGRRSIRQALLFALGCLRLLGARFDVLEADHMPYLHLFPLRAVCWIRRRPMIVTWHEVWGRRYWTSYLGKLGVAANLVEWLCMRLPDAILAASEQTATRLRQSLGPDANVVTAPNGIDAAAIASSPRADSTTDIVTVGRLMAHKRIDLLVDAVAELHAVGQPVSCRIIGTGPEYERVIAHIDRLGLVDRIEVRTDVTDNEELIRMVKASRVFVLASEREGFGIAALEGFACGLPVVTTTAPDNLAQHLVQSAPGGVLCPPTVLGLTEGIRSVLEAPERTPDSEDLRAWLAPYSWTAVTATVAGVLCHACSTKDRSKVAR